MKTKTRQKEAAGIKPTSIDIKSSKDVTLRPYNIANNKEGVKLYLWLIALLYSRASYHTR